MASDPALKMPTETQLYNFLNSVRNGGLKGPFTFAELYEWCETHSPVPDPEQSDEPFVVNYQINVDDDADDDHERLFPLNDEGIQSVPINQSSFRILISSRRLLSILSSTQVIQADSTYKLVWQGFPVQVIGFSDKNNTFHPCALAICTTETEDDFHFCFAAICNGREKTQQPKLEHLGVLCDAADAISNGFAKAFYPEGGSYKRGMCWFHMRKAVSEHVAALKDKELQQCIMKDIDVLQLATSSSLFDAATKLFCEKYAETNNPEMEGFIKYFHSEWIVSHSGWYEGYQSGCSTNNGLESTNRVIKDDHTFRERLVR